MIVLLGLFLLVTISLPWINLFTSKLLKKELAELRQESAHLRDLVFTLNEAEPPAPEPDAFEIETQKPGPAPTPPISAAEPLSEQSYRVPVTQYSRERMETLSERIQAKGTSNFELDIGTKLPVWIGAVSLICAAFFLVKYSIEAGWLGPAMRVSLGALFGASLIGAGQWIARRTNIANYDRISQGLVGAGIVSLYVSLYAAINLYSLLQPTPGFAAMTGVTALAVILSLRHGQAIAAFGLVGGLMTPALIGSPEPNVITLFGYLFLLFAGMLFILARKGWWILAGAALAGLFIWTGIWYETAFSDSDAFVLVAFAMAVCGLVLGVTQKYITPEDEDTSGPHEIHKLNHLALGGAAFTIIYLNVRITLSLFDWSMLSLLSLACIGLVYFRPGIYMRALCAKLSADLILLLIWMDGAPLANAVAVTSGLAAIYVVLPYFLMRKTRDPRQWAVIQCVAAIALYLICWLQLDIPATFSDHRFWGITGLGLGVMSIVQAKKIRETYQANDGIQDYLVAIYALAATAFISLGLSIEVERTYLPLVFSAEAAAVIWIYSRTGIEFLKKIAMILTLVFIGANMGQIELFTAIITNGLFGEAPSRYAISGLMLHLPLLKLGVSALFMGLASLLYTRTEEPEPLLFHLLFSTTLALILATGYYLLRDIFQTNSDFFSVRAGFIERGVITVASGALGIGILQLARYWNTERLRRYGLLLLQLTMVRLVWFDLVILNPYLSPTQFVGNLPILNGVTMVYGAGILLSILGMSNRLKDENLPGAGNVYALTGLAFLFALISLTVRQYFHGGTLAQGIMNGAEFYTYSVAWLLTGLGLLGFGLVYRNKTARIASLSFLLLTVTKVFLFDASELEGLYRVFSFLGLGLSLICLSFFYARFFLKKEGRDLDGN
jgi:uncharacterized membrane protein